ncbi:DUF554 domain-containing protein [Clostridium aminobutyricum]|uniref:DUF554 domain-containing protein n=1 Tax=Clostridium aminobutyricum TaxID=33953 RepID=A0A939DB10_CLOAM|nr:DUF554 domain-containing protein [Clostridium aminobutyricum]MBN7774307.1 DUF554 domain-containing protein [Clostridium aminobutyricum]
MIGAMVNALAIAGCGVLGTYVIKGVPERFEKIVMKSIALALIYIGIAGALQNQQVMVLILSLVLGALIGEAMDINKGMNKLGQWIEYKMGFSGGTFSQGFVSTSILFCTGSMSIVGALNSGLQGNNEMLFAKAILDGILAIIFASQLGIGVVFSAIPVLLYEGSIALCATFMKDLLTEEIIREMSAVGSLLIAAIGFNFMEVKEIKVANLIPAIFLPWLFIAIQTHIL